MVEPIERPRFYDLTTADGVAVRGARAAARHERARHDRRADVHPLHAASPRAAASARSRSRCARARRRRSSAPSSSPRWPRPRCGSTASRQMVMTTGTSNGAGPRRASTSRAACARSRRPCPTCRSRSRSSRRSTSSGSTRCTRRAPTAIGIHIESLDPDVRARWTPGKATVPLARYGRRGSAPCSVFGRNRVSTYLLVGLGEDPDELVADAEALIDRGVYPFVVPYRPLVGSLAHADGVPAPDPATLAERHAAASASALARGGHARRRPGRGLRGVRRLLGPAGGGRMSARWTLGRVAGAGRRRRRALRADCPVVRRADSWSTRGRAARRVPARCAGARSSRSRGCSPAHDEDAARPRRRDDRARRRRPRRRRSSAACALHPEDARARLVARQPARLPRDGAAIGAQLVQAACARAATAGALRFDAHVQERLVERSSRGSGGSASGALEVAGAPHELMRFPITRLAELAAATKQPLGELLDGLLPRDRWLGDDGVPGARHRRRRVRRRDRARDGRARPGVGGLVRDARHRARPRRDGRDADRRAGRRRRPRRRARRARSCAACARAPRRSTCRSSAATRTSACPPRSASPASAAPTRPVAAGGGARRRRAARLRRPRRRLAPRLHGPPVGLDAPAARASELARCSTPSRARAPARRQGRLDGRASSARSGCSPRPPAAARARRRRHPAARPAPTLGDWLTCFPGFAMVAAGRRRTRPRPRPSPPAAAR